MNTFSTPDARFWQERLRPVETLLWVGRPRFTVTLSRSTLWAITPACLYAAIYLARHFREDGAAGIVEMLSDWQDHPIPLTMIAVLILCALYLFRFGFLLPSQHLYAITDRRLMVWRKTASPRLIEEEVDRLTLTLTRPERPPNSVHFTHEMMSPSNSNGFSLGRSKVARRPVGFVNPQDPDGMERALDRALAGVGRRA